MALKDRLNELRPKSVLESELAKLSAEDYTVLTKAAKDPKWSTTQLREALRREGVNVPKEPFAKWRRDVTG